MSLLTSHSSSPNQIDPMNKCNGHGTHVAGVVGADARNVGAPIPFVGIAPEVTFGAYRVLGCDGRGSTDFIMRVGCGCALM
jgi:subtilisin family serine protease